MRADHFCLFVALAAVSACQSAPPEPESRVEREPTPAPVPATRASAVTNGANTVASATPAATPVAKVKPSPDDPLRGEFSLDDATRGLAGSGPLEATILTSLGTLKCSLYDDRAPVTVANFVGLARGLRPWKGPGGQWLKKPAYDGTTFHRVIKGFMIQGGDPAGNGSGGPGYVIPDEVWPGARHDQRGLLCMANRGPNTNGQQFFILDGPAPHLDRGYTIFGKCGPDAVIEKLAGVEVAGDRAVKPPAITRITVRRLPRPPGKK